MKPYSVNKVYRTGTPVAHKGGSLNPIGYINREINKGSLIKPSNRRSRLATLSLKRAAQRRQSNRQKSLMYKKKGGVR
jgi:hypothetical protein